MREYRYGLGSARGLCVLCLIGVIGVIVFFGTRESANVEAVANATEEVVVMAPITPEPEILRFRALWGLECREYDYPREITGLASWYGGGEALNVHTANGEIFYPMAMTAAHLKLPFNTIVEVTNLDNGNTVNVRINDRGPNPRFTNRVIDLSRGAMSALGGTNALNQGLVRVKIHVVELGPECR